MEENYLEMITEATSKGDYKNIGRLVRKAKRKGYQTEDLINALSAGLIDVSNKYKNKGMYLDDIIKAAGSFEVGVQSIGISDEEKEPEKKVVLAVLGGPWTIGTNIVAANLKANGFQVINAGSDVSPEQVLKTISESKARILASAIYLVQTTAEIEKLENELWNKGLRHKMRTILSGPAGSSNIANKYNVDAYVKDVQELIQVVKQFSKELKSEMSHYDRVMTSVAHREPDRVPFMPFAQTFSAKVANIPFSAYVSKAEKFLEGQLKAYHTFGWDALCFSSDVGMYAESFGAKIDFPYDDVPRIIDPILKPGSLYEDYKKLKMPDLMNAGRLTESIKAIELAKKEVKDEIPLIGWTEGPFQGVTLLSGADPMQFFYILDHEDEFKEILDWYADFEIEVAKSMYEAGADIIGLGETAAYFMSPTFFKGFCLEPEKKVCQAIQKMKMIPLIHCCGFVPQNIHFSMETNPGGAIQFDYQVDLKWAKNLIGDKVTIMGNLNYNKLTYSNPTQVYEDCIQHISDASHGGGYWLAFGCEIPRDLPLINMRAIMNATRSVKPKK